MQNFCQAPLTPKFPLSLSTSKEYKPPEHGTIHLSNLLRLIYKLKKRRGHSRAFRVSGVRMKPNNPNRNRVNPNPTLKNSRRLRRHRPNTKTCGERSEAAFLYKASQLGFGVAKPWGDSERYDFILDNGRRRLPSRSKPPTRSAPAPTKLAPPTPSAKAARFTHPGT